MNDIAARRLATIIIADVVGASRDQLACPSTSIKVAHTATALGENFRSRYEKRLINNHVLKVGKRPVGNRMVVVGPPGEQDV
jgi:hypothetical protein